MRTNQFEFIRNCLILNEIKNMQDRHTLLQIMYAPPAFLPRMSATEIHDRIENIKAAKKTMQSNLDWFQLDGYQKHLQENLNQLIK